MIVKYKDNKITFDDLKFNKAFKKEKASNRSWYDLSLNTNEVHLCLRHNIREKRLKVEIYIEDNLDLFNYIMKHKVDIEKKYGHTLKVEEKKDIKVRKLYDDFNFCNGDQKENWKEYVGTISLFW